MDTKLWTPNCGHQIVDTKLWNRYFHIHTKFCVIIKIITQSDTKSEILCDYFYNHTQIWCDYARDRSISGIFFWK